MQIFRRWFPSRAQSASARPRQARSRRWPALESLEERCLLAAFVVNSLADGAPVADGQLTLREAILAANTNAPSGDAPAGNSTLDTIRFDFSIFGGTIGLLAPQGELQIQGGGDLSIVGPDAASLDGIVISGQDSVRVFNIIDTSTPVTIQAVTFENLTVTRGANGGILNTGPNTTLRNVAITNNFGTSGGGVNNSVGGLTIVDSLISGNETNGGGGGGVENRDGSLTVIRSEISGNFATGLGGGLNSTHSGGVSGVTMAIIDSLVSGNHTSSSGGGVACIVASAGNTLFIQGSTIAGNTAILSGGAIVANTTTTILNSTIAGNLSESLGGGIYFTGNASGPMTIVNATIVRNSDTSDVAFNGSSAGGIAALTRSVVHLSNSIVSLNTAVAGREDNVELGDLDTNVGNFIGGNPRLGPLADNGGPTPTILPLPFSPVIDNGSNAATMNAGLTRDQRGGRRLVDGNANATVLVDTGAVEVTPLAAPLVVGADAGGAPHVKVFNPNGSLRFSFFAYPASFTGGVRVATGDVTGDGVDDIITAPGRRRPARQSLQRRQRGGDPQLLRLRRRIQRRRVRSRRRCGCRWPGRRDHRSRARRGTARPRVRCRQRRSGAGRLFRLRQRIHRRGARGGRRSQWRRPGRYHHRARSRRRPAREGLQRCERERRAAKLLRLCQHFQRRRLRGGRRRRWQRPGGYHHRRRRRGRRT